MLNKRLIYKFISAFINWFLIGSIGLILFLISNLFIEKKNLYRLDTLEVYFALYFFSLLISISYAFLFIIIFYKTKISLFVKAMFTSLVGTIIIYLFFYAAGGTIFFNDPQTLVFFFIILFLGFLVPYSYVRINKFILETRNVINH